MSADRPRGHEALAARFRSFATRECSGISPLYEKLALAVAEDDALLDLAATARPGQPPANMLFAAVQALLLADPAAHPLARFYASITAEPAGPAEAFPEFRAFCLAESDAIETLLASRVVSTNEPARAACLLPAILAASEALGAPPFLIEIGASAGLLLLWNRYAYDYGPLGRCGSTDATLTLACESRGAAPKTFPPSDLPRLAGRLGLDPAPLDPTEAEDRAWLRALIWPEEIDRRDRLDRALDVAAEDPPPLRKGDATRDLEPLAAALPSEIPICLLHAFTYAQIPASGQARIETALSRLARERPVARIGFEWEGDRPAPLVSMTLYESTGPRRHELALADAHGRWIEWL